MFYPRQMLREAKRTSLPPIGEPIKYRCLRGDVWDAIVDDHAGADRIDICVLPPGHNRPVVAFHSIRWAGCDGSGKGTAFALEAA